MSSDVFIISAVLDADTPTAIRRAVALAGIGAAHVHDVVFGLDDSGALPNTGSVVHAAGLSCPAACIWPSLRAVFFAAASVLSDDVEVSLVIGLDGETSIAIVVASSEAVGRLNLMPRARLAARSLAGAERAFQAEGVTSSDVEITKTGGAAMRSLYELLDELESKAARWGLISSGETCLLVERV